MISVKCKDTIGKRQLTATYKYQQQDGICDMYMEAVFVPKDLQTSLGYTYPFVIDEFIANPFSIKPL